MHASVFPNEVRYPPLVIHPSPWLELLKQEVWANSK